MEVIVMTDQRFDDNIYRTMNEMRRNKSFIVAMKMGSKKLRDKRAGKEKRFD